MHVVTNYGTFFKCGLLGWVLKVPGRSELLAHAIANAISAGAFVFFMVLLLPQSSNATTKSLSHSASSRMSFFVMRAVLPTCNPLAKMCSHNGAPLAISAALAAFFRAATFDLATFSVACEHIRRGDQTS